MVVPTNRNKKPTQDPEIAAVINSEEPIVEEPKVEEEEIVIPEGDKPTEEAPEEPVEPIVEPQKSEETPKKPDIDYKEKFSASSQEALTLHFKNQKLQATIEEAGNLPEPTDAEVKVYAEANGTNYDDLDDLTKSVLKKTLHSERKFAKIQEAQLESRNIDEWVGKVGHFVDSPEVFNKYPDLVDNADEFRAFAIKQSRRGMDLDDLATSFLYGLSVAPAKRNKGALLMQGGNGSVVPPKPEGITDDQAKMIRVSNPKEYRRLVKEGKIKIEI